MSDIFPRRDGDLVTWLKNYRDKIVSYQKELGWADAQVLADQKICDDLIASIQLNEKKRNEYQAQVDKTNMLRGRTQASLRDSIRLIKALPAYKTNPTIGRDLSLIGVNPIQPLTSTIKPEFSTHVMNGFVRIKFKKGKLDGVNVYSRPNSEQPWVFLARDTNSPYDDYKPAQKPGVSETREYRLIGVIKDEEVTAPSDVAIVTIPG